MSFSPAPTHRQTGSPMHPATTVSDLVDRLATAPPTLLAVWSHPDDEAFCAGGLLAEVSRRGGCVVNVTATAGEHGTDDPSAHPPEMLAVRRMGELASALAELGAEPAISLGLDDGGCSEVPDRLGARMVGTIIDRISPDVIVSFGSDGVTGHPDHRAVARWTRQAVGARGDLIPLLTTAAAAAWSPTSVDRLAAIGAFWPGFPDGGADRTARVSLLDPWQLDRKLAALGRHASQMGRVEAALGTDGFRALASAEAYRASNAAATARLFSAVTAHAA